MLKKNSISGGLVVADVLLDDSSAPEGERASELQQSIRRFCRESLALHKAGGHPLARDSRLGDGAGAPSWVT